MPEDRPEDYRPGSGQATNPQDGAGQRPIQDGGNTILRVTKESLLTKSNQYGGLEGQFGYRCKSESTKWSELKKVNYWSTGSISGVTNGNTLTLETNQLPYTDSWMEAIPDDFVNASVAHYSYVEMEVKLTVSDFVNSRGELTNLPPYSERFKVCLEENDSISATVGTSLYNFSLIKGGVECISEGFVADLNAMGWSNYKITCRILEGVHCSQEKEYVAPLPNVAIEADDDPDGGMTPDIGFIRSQESLYAVLGVLLLVGMFLFIRAGVKGGSSDD